MGKVHGIAGDGAPMPGFDDGMVDMAGPIRVMAESPVNEAMGARADGAREGGNRRNGCRERRPVAGVGAIDLGIPKPRAGGCSPEGPIGRYPRAARTMGVDRMGAGRVPGMCPSPDESVADLRGRDPSDATCPHIRLDAAHIECGDAGRAQPTAPATAIGADRAGAGAFRGPAPSAPGPTAAGGRSRRRRAHAGSMARRPGGKRAPCLASRRPCSPSAAPSPWASPADSPPPG